MAPPSGKLRVAFIKTLWGVTPAMGNAPGGYGALFARIKSEGFAGVETPVRMVADAAAFRAALDAAGLEYVAMVNTCTFAPDDTASDDPEAHLASFQAQLLEAAALRPTLVNAHSGRDSWPLPVATAFLERALALGAASGLAVAHETHRGRILYNPWVTRDLVRALPALRLTADLSHFCVVGERVFSPSEGAWADALAAIAPATVHIHARVGYAQGPQVPHPAAPEAAGALAAHEGWWRAILAARAAAGQARLTVEPEHGTDGYQQRLPYTGVETADIWQVNGWLRDHLARALAGLDCVDGIDL